MGKKELVYNPKTGSFEKVSKKKTKKEKKNKLIKKQSGISIDPIVYFVFFVLLGFFIISLIIPKGGMLAAFFGWVWAFAAVIVVYWPCWFLIGLGNNFITKLIVIPAGIYCYYKLVFLMWYILQVDFISGP